MSESPKSSVELSEQKRALLEKLLQEQGLSPHLLQRIPRRDPATSIPLSFAQQRLWFLYQLEGPSGTYNVPLAFLLTGPLNVYALEQSINHLIRRHEILRTTFALMDDQPRQVIAPGSEVNLQIQDLSNLSQAEREREVHRLATKECVTPFDLVKGPLMRLTLLNVSELEHALLLTLHHNIFDEWSQDVLFHELSILYEAYSNGQTPLLPELPIQYADFTIWQRHMMQGEALENHLTYWKDKLSGTPYSLELPFDHPRPPIQLFRGNVQYRTMPGSLATALQRLGHGERVTLFTLLLTAFYVLLYRYTGQKIILVGSPIANRKQPELKDLIGFFLNTLVFRADLSDEPSFRTLLKQVNETVLQALDHQDLPFDKLVEDLKPTRDLSRHPLFQVAFVFHPASKQSLTLAGLQISPIEVDYGWSKFDLTLALAEQPDGLHARVEYNADLFDAVTVQRMLGHLETLLAGIVAKPDFPISELPILTEFERHQLLVEWNDTRRDYPRNAAVHQLFEVQAASTPEAVAIVFPGQSLTYLELNLRANQLARYLRKLGIGSGEGYAQTLAGICMERSVEMVVAMLAILKAGGAYVPLDPTYPPERLAFMLQDTGAPVVLTQERWINLLPESQARPVIVDQDWPMIELESGENLLLQNSPLNLAYVMYTSGSTGIPKGICIPHRAINRLVCNTDYIRLKPTDRIAQASNMSFDAATFEIWGALLNGACLVGVPQDIVLSPKDFTGYIRQQGIHVLFLTTALFNQFAASEPAAFASLRDLMFGGEAVTPAWVRKVLHASPPQRLLHVYGPTESTTFTTWYQVEKVPDEVVTIPIGHPISNTCIYVLDQHLKLVPVGVPGELYIGGEGLARGYYRRPELTEEKFIPNPFIIIPGMGEEEMEDKAIGERLYKTGDLVKYLPDGSLEFLGRLDEQVKIHGFRVELGEIEAVLAGHASVEQTAVMLREDTPGDKRLVAYLVIRSGAEVAKQELRDFLKARLPSYMVPTTFEFMATMPLNPNGKVDRKALPIPGYELLDKNRQFLTPRDALEAQLTHIWEMVLGVQPIGMQDNFFDLGGHSLLAVRLFTQIERETGKRLPLSMLFQSPTIAQLADVLRQEAPATGWKTLVPIQTQGSRPPFYCVHNFGGEVLNFARLSEQLGIDQPFYGLQAQGLDGVEPPHTNIQQMAAHYVKILRAHQPKGPYYLGGYCFGGIVAYEMACQIQSLGETVGLLAVIDAAPPNQPGESVSAWNLSRIRNYLRNIPIWMVNFVQSGSAEMRVVIRRRIRLAGKAIARKYGKTSEVKPLDIIGDAISNAPPHHRNLMEIHLQALMDYKPPIYAGRVTLFRIRGEPLLKFQDSDKGWRRLASGGVDIRYIPGGHHDLLGSAYVKDLAKELKACLEEVF